MIDNKIVKIEVPNEFDKGWALFRPFTLDFESIKGITGISISYIVSKITKASAVNLVLSEVCLSSAIVKELEWVGKYIDIKLIVKKQDIATFYSSKFKASSVRVDSSITINYLAILDKEPIYIMIGDDYTETDSLVNDVYFNGKKANSNLAYDNATDVILLYSQDDKPDYERIKAFKNMGLKVYCIIDKNAYSREIYDSLKSSDVNLLISSVSKTGVIAVENGELYLVHYLSGGLNIKEKIQSIDLFARDIYKSLFLEPNCDYDKLLSDMYIWESGKIATLNIKPKIEIKIQVPFEDIYAFINEEFDKSILDSHNDYSGEAESVEYIFELIPPFIAPQASYSKIYLPLFNWLNEWKRNRSYVFRKCAEAISGISNVSKLYSICNNITIWDKWVEQVITNYDFADYSSKLASFKELLEDAKVNLLTYIGDIYASLGTTSDSGRFDKFDDEIAGYEQTIVEKKALVAKGIDVLSNKRRIEILQKKIGDLLALKARFESTSGTRNDKVLSAFLAKCEDYLKGGHRKQNDDSLGNIVKVKEETKENLLDAFASRYLFDLSQQIEVYLNGIYEITSIEIPDDYIVYELEGKRMILIEDIEEVSKTKAIQNKFNLVCVASRGGR